MESCSLRDLNLIDKRKVAKLIKQVNSLLKESWFSHQSTLSQVVALKQDNESVTHHQNKIMKELERRNKQLNLRNREIIKENANSRSKLMQALVMIKSYQQQKIQIRALEKGKELREIIQHDGSNTKMMKPTGPDLEMVVEEVLEFDKLEQSVKLKSQGTNTEPWIQTMDSKLQSKTALSPLKLRFDPMENPYGRFMELQKIPRPQEEDINSKGSQSDLQELHSVDESLLDLIKEVEVISKIYDQNDELNQPWISSGSTDSILSNTEEQELLCDLFSETNDST